MKPRLPLGVGSLFPLSAIMPTKNYSLLTKKSAVSDALLQVYILLCFAATCQ